MSNDILESLKRRQAELQESDTAFAKRLGISRTLWSYTRAGKRTLSKTLLKGAKAAFPDMDWDVLMYWLDEIRNHAEKGRST